MQKTPKYPAKLLSLRFWSSYWITMRPYLIFVSGAAGLVGLAFIEHPELPRLALAFIPLLLSYGLGQAVTDCFQIDTDSLSAAYRPLVKGIISIRQVLIVSLTGLTGGAVILGCLNLNNLWLGAAAVVGVNLYTRLKRTWWGGPPWNSLVVALLPVMGRLTERRFSLQQLFAFGKPPVLAFPLAVGAIFFGYANFVVMGYLKDISADTATGYRTFPVVFGWKAAAVYSDVTALLAAALTAGALFCLGPVSAAGLAVLCCASLINLLAQIRIHRLRKEKDAHGPIADVVRALILYCLSLAISLKPAWIGFALVFYLLFELSLRSRPEHSQV